MRVERASWIHSSAQTGRWLWSVIPNVCLVPAAACGPDGHVENPRTGIPLRSPPISTSGRASGGQCDTCGRQAPGSGLGGVEERARGLFPGQRRGRTKAMGGGMSLHADLRAVSTQSYMCCTLAGGKPSGRHSMTQRYEAPGQGSWKTPKKRESHISISNHLRSAFRHSESPQGASGPESHATVYSRHNDRQLVTEKILRSPSTKISPHVVSPCASTSNNQVLVLGPGRHCNLHIQQAARWGQSTDKPAPSIRGPEGTGAPRI